MKRTAKLFVLTYTLAGSAVTIHSYKGMNGTGAPYAPDVRTVNGTGDLSLQWSIPVFVDPYDIAFPIRTKDARGTGHGSAALIVNPTAIDGGVRVRTFLHDGTPADGKVTVVGW
jgi:hypothetical protein